MLSLYKTPNKHICSLLFCKGGLCFNPSRRVARLAGAPSFHVNRPLVLIAIPTLAHSIFYARESSFNMTRGERMKILKGGGGRGSENLKTPERGALKKLAGLYGHSKLWMFKHITSQQKRFNIRTSLQVTFSVLRRVL